MGSPGRPATASCYRPTQCMKFLMLRNENEVLESGKLLLPTSEPGCAASTTQLASELASRARAGKADAIHEFITYDPQTQGFFPHFTTG